MKEKLPLMAFLFLCFFNLKAQKNFHAAYIVLNNDDTLKGYIDYREWYRNPSKVLFKLSEEPNMKPYSINEVKYFEVTGGQSYRRQKVKITLDSEDLKSSFLRDTSTRSEIVFLEILHAGKNISLYSYTDEIKRRFYIDEGSNNPYELLNSSYLVNGRVVNEQQYRYQLSKVAVKHAPGNQKLIVAIRSATYSKKTLLNLCAQVNGVDANTAKNGTRKTLKEKSFIFFVGTGINRSSINFTGTSQFADRPSSPSSSLLLNIGIDVLPVPSIGKLFWRNTISISGFKIEVSSKTQSYFQAWETYYLTLTQRNVAINSQINYNLFQKSNFRWYVGAGIGFNFCGYPTNRRTFVRTGLNSSTTTEDDHVEFNRKFWLNTSFRSGIAIKNIELAVQFHPRAAITDYHQYAIKNKSLQIQVNYLLKRKLKPQN